MNTITIINGRPIRPIKPKRNVVDIASGKYQRALKRYKQQLIEYKEYVFSHSMELDNISSEIIQKLRDYYNKTYGNKKGSISINDLMEMGQFMSENGLGLVKTWLGPEDQYFIHLKKEVRKYIPEYEPPRGWKHADGWYGNPMKSDN